MLGLRIQFQADQFASPILRILFQFSYDSLSDGDVLTNVDGSTIENNADVLPLTSNLGTGLNQNGIVPNYKSTVSTDDINEAHTSTVVAADDDSGRIRKSLLNSRFTFLFEWTTSYAPGKIPFYLLIIATLTSSILIAMFFFGLHFLHQWWFIVLMAIFFLITISSLLYMSAFNQDPNIDTFQVSKQSFALLNTKVNFDLNALLSTRRVAGYRLLLKILHAFP